MFIRIMDEFIWIPNDPSHTNSHLDSLFKNPLLLSRSKFKLAEAASELEVRTSNAFRRAFLAKRLTGWLTLSSIWSWINRRLVSRAALLHDWSVFVFYLAATTTTTLSKLAAAGFSALLFSPLFCSVISASLELSTQNLASTAYLLPSRSAIRWKGMKSSTESRAISFSLTLFI